MYDHNVFAVLTAKDQGSRVRAVFKLPENAKWYRPAVEDEADKSAISSREPTPAPFDDQQNRKDNIDCLIITFDQPLKNTQSGLQLGTNPVTSDILLGRRGSVGISAKQFSITIDRRLGIWLHDYQSTYGTAVGYGDANEHEIRKKETWMLSQPLGLKELFREVSFHVGTLAVKIQFPNHGTTVDPQYVRNLTAFFCLPKVDQGLGEVPAIGGLELYSQPTTQAPSVIQTPGERLIYYFHKQIGQGSFGKVYMVIRVRDGKVVAAKTFKAPAKKRNIDEDDPAWLIRIRREFLLMQAAPHANIMQVFEFRETPKPVIFMAYYPDGNISNAEIIDQGIYVTAFGQILDGLQHLHARGIAHRDLKPDNFLIQRKPHFKVVIADFGLSNIASDTTLLMTFCGTLKYVAPEIFPGFGHGYGPLVDIWSLGVIVLEWIYGIPTCPAAPEPGFSSGNECRAWIDNWSGRLLRKLNDQDDDQLIEIILCMLARNLGKRRSAAWCLTRGFKNGLFKRRTADGLVVEASYKDEGLFPSIAAAAGDENKDAEDGGASTPTRALPPRQIKSSCSAETTILEGNLGGEFAGNEDLL